MERWDWVVSVCERGGISFPAFVAAFVKRAPKSKTPFFVRFHFSEWVVVDTGINCLLPLTPRRVHRGEVRVGHDRLRAEFLEVPRNPLALRRRLDQNSRLRPLSHCKSLPICVDSAVPQGPPRSPRQRRPCARRCLYSPWLASISFAALTARFSFPATTLEWWPAASSRLSSSWGSWAEIRLTGTAAATARSREPRCTQYSESAGMLVPFGSTFSVMRASAVRRSPATEAAFCSAERTTFVGSTMPAFMRSSYSSVAALKP